MLQDLQEEIALDNLEAWAQSKATRVVREVPMRKISLCERPEKPDWYFKLLRGLGEVKENFCQALKWRFRPSRFLRVLKISQELEDAGFRCPRIILAARKRTWWPFGHPTDFMILEAARGRLVAYYLSGEDGLPRMEGEERIAMLKRMGSELARLHCAGFVHGDCHPGNYFWDEGADGFCYIDNDRTCRHGKMNISGAIRNLVSAGFYLLHRNRITQKEWELLMDAYVQEAHFSCKEETAFRHRVSQGITKRIAVDK